MAAARKPWDPPALPPPLSFRREQKKQPASTLLDFEELERFENLLVFARVAVEGFFAGKHRSPWTGSSTEFADYKEYTAGDDLDRIDWRVYGRTRRLFIRQYEDETDMTVHLLVDASASMRYAGEKRRSKFHLAARIAAALAYLMHKQGDKSALALFSDHVTTFLPPGGTRRHLHLMVSELERTLPAKTTGLAAAINECFPLCKKRGRLVVISDFLDDHPALFDALSRFLHRKFEILLLQVLDPDELHLPGNAAARFVDSETRESVQVDPEEIRAAYTRKMRAEIDSLAREADLRQVQHQLVDTRSPYIHAIETYLGFRGRNQISR